MNKRGYKRKAEKRRIYCCVCGGIFESIRSDAISCSPKCRVKAHRLAQKNPGEVLGSIECGHCGICSYRARSIPCPVCGAVELDGADG